MTLMRANIVGPPDVATRIKASMAACHSVEFPRRGCGAKLGRFLQSIHRLDWYQDYVGVDRSTAGRQPALHRSRSSADPPFRYATALPQISRIYPLGKVPPWRTPRIHTCQFMLLRGPQQLCGAL